MTDEQEVAHWREEVQRLSRLIYDATTKLTKLYEQRELAEGALANAEDWLKAGQVFKE